MAGYAGGFVGPLVIGWVLDWSGGMSPLGWGLAFLHLSLVVLLGQICFMALRPRALTGDRGPATPPPKRGGIG
jgi:dipeptide/tripeptide permease